jgi:hypothetical protein
MAMRSWPVSQPSLPRGGLPEPGRGLREDLAMTRNMAARGALRKDAASGRHGTLARMDGPALPLYIMG